MNYGRIEVNWHLRVHFIGRFNEDGKYYKFDLRRLVFYSQREVLKRAVNMQQTFFIVDKIRFHNKDIPN